MAQPMKLSILIGADASGAKAGGAEASRAIGGVTKAANDAGAAINRLIGESTGLNRAFASLDTRADDLAAYGAQLDALRARYNPMFATISRYKAEVASIRDAHRVGAISTSEMTAALSRERVATLASIDAIKGRNVAVRSMQAANANVQGFQTANIAAQFQDIGVTAAMGMNPLQIALQQGTQLSMALGASGAAGSVRALGTAFMSLVSPVSLITLGLVAGTAAVIQYFTSAESGAEKTQKLLEAQNETIRKAAQLWGQAAPAFQAYVTELDRVSKLGTGRDATEVLATREFDGQAESLRGLSTEVQQARDELARLGADDKLVYELGVSFSTLWKNLESGKATIGDILEVKRQLGLAAAYDAREVQTLQSNFEKLTASMVESVAAAQKVRSEFIKSIAGGTDVQDIVGRNTFRDVDGNTRYTDTFVPKNPPVPTIRPNIELEGSDTASGARANIAAQVEARQSLLQTQQEQIERMRLESRMIGASSRERAVLTAALTAEQELRRQGISILSQEGQAYIANARAIASERVETERLNALQISRDPAGQRSNIEEQVRSRQSLWQAQRDELDGLSVEARLVGASTRERAVMTAALQAEQALRRQGISALSEEGRAYVENAKAIAATRVEIERQNGLAISRNPAGARSNIIDQVQARQQLTQSQNDEIEKLRLEQQMVGASDSVRARANATLEAEQRLRQSGIRIVSQEGQAYIANAQSIAQARLELERQQAAYQATQQAGSTMIDQLTVGTGTLKERLKSMAETALTTFQQLAVANPLKNQLLGTNLPTLTDVFSGKSASPLSSTTTGTMTVTAATVIINGAPIGTGPLDATRLLNPANQNVVNGVRPDLAAGGIVNNPLSATAPASNVEAYIRQSAVARGIDPNVAVRVAQSEGGLQSWNLQSQYRNASGIQEQSYGPYQLYMGGGLGNRFQAQTGLDPRLAANGPAGVDFALDTAKQEGWGAWYGARKAGISNWQGITPGTSTTSANSSQQITENLTKLSTSSAVASSSVTSMATGAQTATAGLGDFSSGIGGFFQKLVTGAFADGAAFSGGSVVPFATGGVVSKPTFFPMAGGRAGLMGEAGPEAIMPLERGAGGRLGVRASIPRGARQGGEMRLRYETANTLNIFGTTDRELLAQANEGMRMQLEESERRLRATMPQMIEEYRANPWARNYG